MKVESGPSYGRAEASGSCACRTVGVLEGVGEGVQEIRPPVRYQRPGRPEQGARTGGFEGPQHTYERLIDAPFEEG